MLIEDMITELLPPGVEGGVSYCCGYKRPGVDSGTTHITEDSATVHEFFNFLSGFEKFMQKHSWGSRPKITPDTEQCEGYPSFGSWHSCLQEFSGTNFSSLRLEARASS
jgi:hypothetical protein